VNSYYNQCQSGWWCNNGICHRQGDKEIEDEVNKLKPELSDVNTSVGLRGKAK